MVASGNNNRAATRRALPSSGSTVEFLRQIAGDRDYWVLGASVGGEWSLETFHGGAREALAERWIAARYAEGLEVWLVLGDVRRPVYGAGLDVGDIVGYRYFACSSAAPDAFTTPQARGPFCVWRSLSGAVALWKFPSPVSHERAAYESGVRASDCCIGKLTATAQLYYIPLPRDMVPVGVGGSMVRMPRDTPAGAYVGLAAAPGAQPGQYAPVAADHAVVAEADKYLAYQVTEALEAQKITGGRIVGVTRGPLVTVVDYEPARSEKSKKVLDTSRDVARLIKSASVITREDTERGVICFDVSNAQRETVRLSDVQTSPEWEEAKRRMALPYILGVTSAGVPLIVDFAQAPHMLKAGSTGSGKSTGMNSGIVSLLEARGPDKLRVILIDPKRVELSVYGRHKQAPTDIPHLLAPIANDATKAATALEWALVEMNRRYDLFGDEGVSNVDEYNELLAEQRAAGEAGVPDDVYRILIVVDEYAMLLQQAERRVKDVVRSLSAQARASGIYILLATQHPSAKMMSGELRTNFPYAVTYRMAKHEGSVVATGSGIACRLLGNGDALLDRGFGFERIHAPYVSKSEIRERLSSIRALGEPEFAFDYANARPVKASDAGSGYDDSGPVFDAGSGEFTPDEENEDRAKDSPRGAAIAELCKIMPRGVQMRRADVWREMKARGCSKGTFDRASEDLGIDKVDGKGNDQLWTRP